MKYPHIGAKRISVLVGLGLLAIAVCFLGYAANHPEAAFPWSNKVTFLIYGMYLWLLKFLLDIPFLRSIRKPSSNNSFGAAVSFFAMAAVFLLVEITGSEAANIYTVLRGVIFLGGIDLGIESLLAWMKQRHHEK